MSRFAKNVVKIINKDGNSGLGIFCKNDVILSCAHLLIGEKEPTQNSATSFSIIDPTTNQLMFAALTSTADYCLDIMSLRNTDLNMGADNEFEWSDHAKYKELVYDAPAPCEINFLKSRIELFQTGIRGYFFDKDGLNKIKCNILINQDHLLNIICDSKRSVPGCSGGPIFTEDDQLIGIFTNGFGNNEAGIRIDLCLPPIVFKLFGNVETINIDNEGTYLKPKIPEGWS